MFKKLLKTIFVFLASISILIIVIAIIGYEPEETTSTNGPYDYYYEDYAFGDDYLDGRFEWVEYPTGRSTRDWHDVEGIIRNISGQDFAHVSIRFALFDTEGNQVATAHDSISSLGSGNTWRFSASGHTNITIGHFEFSSITAR